MAYVKKTWVDREGTTRYHETVDEDGALIFTPDYEKVTEIGTPVNADNMNHIEEGIEDHENRITVLEEGQDTSEFLNTSQITNCLLEVPQNIKLDLDAGVLTLKAGSKVIIPNGFASNGTTPKFNEITITRDVVENTAGTGTDKFMLFLRSDGGDIIFRRVSTQTGSGTTTPTSGYWGYYNTSTNTVDLITDGALQFNTSFPLAIVSTIDGVTTSIDQVFNGIGYIGSTLWVDKGIKYLIPKGRNADGTLNNIEYTSSIKTVATGNNSYTMILNNTGGFSRVLKNSMYIQETVPTNPVNNTTNWFKPSENQWYRYINNVWTKIHICPIGDFTGNSSLNVTYFNPKEAFRAVDYNNYREDIDSLTDDIDSLTNDTTALKNRIYLKTSIIDGTEGVNIWSNGYCEQWGYLAYSGPGTITHIIDYHYDALDYSVYTSAHLTDPVAGIAGASGGYALTTNQIYIVQDSDNQSKILGTFWRTAGKLASGQY